MADRDSVKAKRKTGAATAQPVLDAAGLAGENARLTAALAEAQARIAELEGKHTEIINRIEWVIDSLRTLDE
ncbi:MAG: hypothetical protein ACRCS9_02525 [Hyphomicrobium sp.]